MLIVLSTVKLAVIVQFSFSYFILFIICLKFAKMFTPTLNKGKVSKVSKVSVHTSLPTLPFLRVGSINQNIAFTVIIYINKQLNLKIKPCLLSFAGCTFWMAVHLFFVAISDKYTIRIMFTSLASYQRRSGEITFYHKT